MTKNHTTITTLGIALPFAVREARMHGNDAFAVCSALCREAYGIFISFPFYFVLFNTYIYFFN
jgi:hypothetical protein